MTTESAELYRNTLVACGIDDIESFPAEDLGWTETVQGKALEVLSSAEVSVWLYENGDCPTGKIHPCDAGYLVDLLYQAGVLRD